MKNRHDDTPVISDYTFYVFNEIEKRGLQFAIPPQWRPLYRAYLRERKRQREITAALQGIVRAFEQMPKRSYPGSYQDDFGDKRAASKKENLEADGATRPLEE